MIIRRSKKFVIQMREYETFAFGADVEMSHHDLGFTDEQVATMSESDYAALRERIIAAVQEELFEQLHEDLDRTAALVENRKSFVRRANVLIRTMTDGLAIQPEPSPKPTTQTAKKAIARKPR